MIDKKRYKVIGDVRYILDDSKREIRFEGNIQRISTGNIDNIHLRFGYDNQLTNTIKERERDTENFWPEVTECLKIARDELIERGVINE